MLRSKCSTRAPISKKCSDLKFNFTFSNFQHSARQKNKKSASEIQLLCMNKNKSSNSRLPLYRENQFSATQKKTHAHSGKIHNIAHKKCYCPSKNIKSWFNIFSPLKKSIIALKMVFTDTFNFQKKTTPLRFKQISE